MVISSLLAAITAFGLKPVDAVKAASRYLKHAEEEQSAETIARRIAETEEVVRLGTDRDALLALYDDDALRAAGLRRLRARIGEATIEMCIAGRPEHLRLDLELSDSNETYLLDESKDLPEIDRDDAMDVLADVDLRGIKVWDAPMYRLRELTVAGKHLSATFSLEHFLRYRVGAGALFDELVGALSGCRHDVKQLVSRREQLLPRRMRLLPNASTLADFRSRSCVGGVQVTVAIRRPAPWNDFVIPVQKRSSAVSEGRGQLSVLPQGYHQPHAHARDGISLRSTALRELYEELLGGERVEGPGIHLLEDWYQVASRPLRWLTKSPHRYRLFVTSLGFNLLSGNYEASLLLYIESPEFWSRFKHELITNWETVEQVGPLVSSRDSGTLRALLSDRTWTTSGLASFCCGLTLLAQLEPSRIADPGFAVEFDP